MEARLFRIQARKRDCEPQKIIIFLVQIHVKLYVAQSLQVGKKVP